MIINVFSVGLTCGLCLTFMFYEHRFSLIYYYYYIIIIIIINEIYYYFLNFTVDFHKHIFRILSGTRSNFILFTR
jgi:hypothetical protein